MFSRAFSMAEATFVSAGGSVAETTFGSPRKMPLAPMPEIAVEGKIIAFGADRPGWRQEPCIARHQRSCLHVGWDPACRALRDPARSAVLGARSRRDRRSAEHGHWPFPRR